MRDLLKRLERLESEASVSTDAVTTFFLIGMDEDPTSAECRGERIDRAEGETLEAFEARAAQQFRPPRGVALISMAEGGDRPK